MKAKLILNEIKRDNTSGISSLGLGKTSMMKAYTYVKQHWPNELEKFINLSESNFLSTPNYDVICSYIKKTFNIDTQQIIIVSIENILDKNLNKWIDNKVSLNFSDVYDDESTSGVLFKHDNTYVFYSSNNYGVGYVTIFDSYANHEKYYFLRYINNSIR